jgi:fructokinase
MADFGAIEAGGTKFNCLVGSGPQDIRAEIRIPTTTPDETFSKVIQFFKEQAAQHPLEAIGVGSFGPVDLEPSSPTYGYITSTPKPGWRMTDFAGAMRRALALPVAFDTDVNAAAYGEYRWGAADGLSQFVYMTVGTGIGAGEMVGGQLVHGLMHPEAGHMRIPHDRQADPYPGFCPFHGDCLEGLASGPAVQARWGMPAEQLAADSPAWELEAQYIASAVVNLVCTLSPQRIILGGGILQQPGLIDVIRQKTLEQLNGYIQAPEILEHIREYIVLPGLGGRAGMLGALALAQALE